MFIRALFAFLALPGIVAGIVPLLILRMHPELSRFAGYGIALLVAGAILLLWCVRDFYIAGKGTLAPWDPPKRLVIVGLYRFMRNPMYVAVLTITVGWSVAFGSLVLAVYTVVLAIAFHLRVVYHEEPWLRKQFHGDWERYSKTVPRWIPRLRSQ
jgi:protein-S-isoprenylcysteine O-methyltransferase Ste14